MLILFDHSTPAPLAAHLSTHQITTARERGWDKLANGELLAAAEQAGFDVLLTADGSMHYQQNLKHRKIALVVLTGNRWRLVQRVMRKIVVAVDTAEAGSFTLIEVPTK
jgi:alkanesulfonate monooxygenase SsuD/methylene tetrahydromethanopterin reductase-like flavin-dependent oxidoreductase (luciferase family)